VCYACIQRVTSTGLHLAQISDIESPFKAGSVGMHQTRSNAGATAAAPLNTFCGPAALMALETVHVPCDGHKHQKKQVLQGVQCIRAFTHILHR